MKFLPIIRITTLLFVIVSGFLSGGCGTLAKEAAIGADEDPYRKQMLAGKISPADYRREKEAIGNAADGSK